MFGSFLYIQETAVYVQLGKTPLLITLANTASQWVSVYKAGRNSKL